MDKIEHIPAKKPAGPADYLANERTFLAWIRTSIALMGFGFVVVKFAVFLRQMAILTDRQLSLPQNRVSIITGIGMVVLGGLMATFAYLRYRNIEKKLQDNAYFPSQWLSMLLTIALVAGCILLLIYLRPVL
ncbi:DUF202 domain-containing protein [Flavisolibacter sp. BT320]|nr:DUF202 domain-containing protein [Flavisolibacter longurius]